MIVIYCPKCGIPNDDNAERCSRCGNLLHEETAETAVNENNSIPSMQEKPYEQYQSTQNQEPTQTPPQSCDPYPTYQQPYAGGQPPYQQPYQPPYGGMPFPPFGNVQLQPYSNTLAIVSLILSIICCNIVPGLILSIIAMTQGSKYNTASSIGNYYDANNAAKLSKILAWVSIGISIVTVVISIFAVVVALGSYDSGYYNYYY